MKKVFIIILLVLTLFGCNAPDQVSIQKDIPIEVNSKDIFNFTITVINDDSKMHEARSIDISHTFLEGVVIIETNYPVKEEYDVLGQQIYEFQKDIPANSKTDFIFTAKAIKPGDFGGDLDVCIDGDASCLFNSIRIIVN